MKNLLLSIVLLLFFQIVTIAQPSVWDGSADIWTKGDGTQESPYLIENAQQFAFVAEMVNGGVTTYSGVYFKLVTDIDLNNKAWTPIGVSETSCFSGSFDGGKHSLFNLNVTSSLNAGVFGYIVDAEINDITIYGKITISESKGRTINIGGLVGYCKSSSITNIISNVNITVYNLRYYSGNSYTVYFRETSNVGGICGLAESTFFCNDVNNGSILSKGSALTAGGIVGDCSNSTEIFNSLNTATIKEEVSKKTFSVAVCIGGITSSVDGATIRNCGNLGNIESTSSSSTSGIAGGRILGVGGIASNCYNTGNLSQKSGISIYCITSNTIKNCYYKKNCGGSGGGTSKTTTSMRSVSFPLMLNVDSTIFIQDIVPSVNYSYPFIKNTSYLMLQNARQVGTTVANIKGTIYNFGEVEDVYFQYKTGDSEYITKKGMLNGYELQCPLSNLQEATTYTYRLYVVVNGEKYYTPSKTFTTSSCSSENTISASICEGEEFNFNGDILTVQGTYTQTLISSAGCDSVVTLKLDVLTKYTIDQTESICEGEEYDFYGTKLTQSGEYQNYVSDSDRCVLVTLNLRVNPSYMIEKEEFILEGDEYEFCGTKLMEAGTYTKTLQTITGCDSVIQLKLTVGEARVIFIKPNVDTLGTVSAGGKFGVGEVITITATPKNYAKFVSWSDGSTENPRTITVEDNVTYIAQFAIKTFSVNASCDATQGEVSGNGEYQYKSIAVLTATAHEGYNFQKWSDNIVENPRQYIVTEDISVFAIFTPKEYTVDVISENEAYGSVWGGGIFPFNTQTTIYASPVSGYSFVMWSDGNTENPRTIDVTNSIRISAKFIVKTFTVDIIVKGFNMGNVQGMGSYTYGTTVEISAVPNYGYVFKQWSDGVEATTRSIVVSDNVQLEAQFENATFDVQIVSNDVSKGTVSVVGELVYDSEIQLDAVAKEHYHFVKWSDGNVENPRNVTIKEDFNLTAEFAIDTFTVSVSVNQSEMGTIQGTGDYTYGQKATLVAEANEHYTFVKWDDGVTDEERVVTIIDNTAYKAIFEKTVYSVTAESLDETMGTVKILGDSFTYGDEIVLMATAKSGCHFVKWSDGNEEATRTMEVSGNKILVAYFEANSTAIDDISNELLIKIINHQILVNGEAPAFVVTVSGQKITNANLKAGVYFVVIDGETVGVSVR